MHRRGVGDLASLEQPNAGLRCGLPEPGMVMIARKDPGSKEPYNKDINPAAAAGVFTGAGWKWCWVPSAGWWNAAAAGYV